MLTRLYIKNFALIEELQLEFGPGFNTITGETGAGKSIVLSALEAVLGGQAGAELVRQGADKALIEGVFEFPADHPVAARLEEVGVALEEGQLILRRELSTQGRTRALANGLTLSLKQLRQVGALLADLHSQHEHHSLLDTGLHALFLDAFGGLGPQAGEVARLFGEWGQSRQRAEELRTEREGLRRAEELRAFQLQEIRQLNPAPGEEEKLAQELRVLENLETLAETTAQLGELLYQAEGSVAESLAKARRQLERLAETDPRLQPQAAALADLVYRVEDLAGGLSAYTRHLETRPERREAVRERLDGLRRLSQKYGGSPEAVLEQMRQLEHQESRADRLDEELRRTQTETEKFLHDFQAACLALSAGRRKAAQSLSAVVEKSLAKLGMEQTVFVVELQEEDQPEGLVEREGRRFRADGGGMERVEFFISPNLGEAPRPLARIASGGELSRLMLALKEVIADRDRVFILVFDEIDTGVSGRVAAAVGKKLRSLAATHQIIAITHLPQIAGLAHTHFSVRKRQRQGRTFTEVHLLDEQGRAEELAKLLAGEKVSASARQHAQELLR
ncbi:MAG: DNA repair protein RecN [Candidatus Handelsmanbacteria bacterium]|nr:DNA repair protein RecN [Candidatus Handelsmanbacteria bacterium]